MENHNNGINGGINGINGLLPFITFYSRKISYHCQMVRMAAIEKGFPFGTINVDHLKGDTYKDEFVRINPACEIPVMLVEDRKVIGSQEIIDYLDNLAHRGTDAELRPHVQAFRRRCFEMPIPEVTLAVTRNAQWLQICRFPPSALDKLGRRVNRIAILEEKIAHGPPDLRTAYQAKLARVREQEAVIATPERVNDLFRRLEAFLDETDLCLKNSSHGNLQEERWLFGKEFTNADIQFAVLLARLDMMGLAGKLWDEAERLFIADYYRRLKKRPSFQLECVPLVNWLVE